MRNTYKGRDIGHSTGRAETSSKLLISLFSFPARFSPAKGRQALQVLEFNYLQYIPQIKEKSVSQARDYRS